MALHVMDEANQCLGCKKPRCQQGCPIQTNIPEVIRLLKANKLDEAGRRAGIVRCCLKDTAPAHACQTPLAIWTGVWDNGLQQRAMPFAPGRIDRRNGAQERPPNFSPKGGCFLC